MRTPVQSFERLAALKGLHWQCQVKGRSGPVERCAQPANRGAGGIGGLPSGEPRYGRRSRVLGSIRPTLEEAEAATEWYLQRSKRAAVVFFMKAVSSSVPLRDHFPGNGRRSRDHRHRRWMAPPPVTGRPRPMNRDLAIPRR